MRNERDMSPEEFAEACLPSSNWPDGSKIHTPVPGDGEPIDVWKSRRAAIAKMVRERDAKDAARASAGSDNHERAKAAVDYALSTDRADAVEWFALSLDEAEERGRADAAKAVVAIGEQNHVAFHHAPRKADGSCGGRARAAAIRALGAGEDDR